MRLIDADELIKDRVENDPVRIAVQCAPTAFDKKAVIEELKSPYNYAIIAGKHVTTVARSIEIVEKGGIE